MTQKELTEEMELFDELNGDLILSSPNFDYESIKNIDQSNWF